MLASNKGGDKIYLIKLLLFEMPLSVQCERIGFSNCQEC